MLKKFFLFSIETMRRELLDILTVACAETIGTAMLVFFGCMGCVKFPNVWVPDHLSICLNFGLTVMVIVNVFGVVSGSHLNPAVTLAALVYKLVNIPASINDSVI
jgi:aquaporin related protein